MKQTIFDRYPELKTIPAGRFPRHICIIPDGNGRWAKIHNKFISLGHKKGFEVAQSLLAQLGEITEVKIVTMWGFSSDNWKRSSQEIQGLMIIFIQVVKIILKDFNRDNRRFIHIGRRERLPKSLQELLEKAEDSTKANTGQILCLAVDFGGEDQDLRVIEKSRQLDRHTSITEETLWQLRDGNGLVRSADLLIRTSGEKRTSDVGWLNGAATELYFTDKLFPDMTNQDLIDAVVDFSKRERRFGART